MQFNLDLQQMDVETTFLNARLTEEVYIEIPQGVQIETPYNCLKLDRALYGLMQTPRAWYEDIQKSLHSRNFKCMQNENCLFSKHTNHSLIIIALYVDDLIIAGTTTDVNEDKHFLNSRYVIKDSGHVHHILGCEVNCDLNTNTLFLTQRRYIHSTVKRFLNTSDLRKVGLNASPMDASISLKMVDIDEDTDRQEQMKSIPYREAIGSLLRLVAGTRADIAFAVHTCAKFSCKPSIKHRKAVLGIFR